MEAGSNEVRIQEKQMGTKRESDMETGRLVIHIVGAHLSLNRIGFG